MNDHNNIQNELKEMQSMLANMPRKMPYAVPQGYFSQLPEHATATVTAGDNVLTLKHDAPYTLPKGYFDQLPETMLTVAKEKTNKRRTIPRAQWLAAAMLACIISFGGYIMFSEHTTVPEQMLSSVPKAELNNYVQSRYGMDVNAPIKEISISNLNIENKDIIAYLNETGWE